MTTSFFPLTHALVVHDEQLVGVACHADDRTGHTEEVAVDSAQSEDAHLLLVGGGRTPAIAQRDRLREKMEMHT